MEEVTPLISSFITSADSFIASVNFKVILLPLKIIFIGIFLVFIILVIFLLLKSTWLKRRFLEDLVEVTTYRPFGVKKTFKQWSKIAKRLDVDNEAGLKLAVIEADSLLNNILEKMGFSGETMADKLQQINSDILPNLEEVWRAHKIRNNVVHDPDYKLTLNQAEQTVGIYEKALRDLEAF